jgi:hypothetical protein
VTSDGNTSESGGAGDLGGLGMPSFIVLLLMQLKKIRTNASRDISFQQVAARLLRDPIAESHHLPRLLSDSAKLLHAIKEI